VSCTAGATSTTRRGSSGPSGSRRGWVSGIVADDEARIAEALTLGLLETLEEYRIAAELRLILREADCARAVQRLAKLGVLDALEGLRRNRRSLGRPLAKIGQILAAARR
jgi:hypothetical protein